MRIYTVKLKIYRIIAWIILLIILLGGFLSLKQPPRKIGDMDAWQVSDLTEFYQKAVSEAERK